jgi:hypothetical protein
MVDHFQLTAIVAEAIRECLQAAHPDQGSEADHTTTEQAHSLAKAALTAIKDAGYQIAPKQDEPG